MELAAAARSAGLRVGGLTAELLQGHLAKWMSVTVSDTTLREQLHQLGYVWKRPRYVLEPDVDREKKTPHSPANPAPS